MYIKKVDLKKSFRELFAFMAILMTILMSKTYYFGVANRSLYQYVYYVVVVLLFLVFPIKIKKLVNAHKGTIVLITLMIISYIWHMGEMNASQSNQVIGTILMFEIVTCMSVFISPEVFSKWYVRILIGIAIISIPCFVIAVTNPSLALSFCQPGYDWQTPAGYSFFYLWGINGVISTRNAGPFWEPGAFQGFLILAILMLVLEVDNKLLKHRKLYFVILTITLLTTQSTTGYIIFLFIVVFFWKKIQKLFEGKYAKTFTRFLIALMAIMAVSYIIGSGNISSKISGLQTESSIIRSRDIVGGMSMIAKAGLFGLGETANRDFMKMLLGINKDDSVGLFAMIYTYGIVFGFFYILIALRGIKKFFKVDKLKNYVPLIIIFLILHLTEGLWFLPVYIYITICDTNSVVGIKENQG